MSDEHEIIVTPTHMGATALEMVTKAEIDTQIATAKKYPRSIKQFMDTALQMVTLNEEVAASCNYGLPRGGKIIEGPSARFAELIYSAWGNARAGARVVHEDSRFVTSQGICHDLQSNTMITFEVKRRITTKHGKTFDDDMIGVTGNAAASIALRNAILKVIPKAFWQPLYNEARRVSMGDSKTLATRRADALAFMQKFGVTLDMVLAKFELKGVEDISLEHLVVLRAAATSIKDGEATVESLFEVAKPEEAAGKETKGAAGVKNALSAKAAKAVAAGADPVTGELASSAANPAAEDATPQAALEAAKAEQAAAAKEQNAIEGEAVGGAGAGEQLPAFDINAHNLKTQAGTKEAVKALCDVLAHYTEGERGDVFVMSGGNDLLSMIGRHGLGALKQHFVALGVKLPE